MRHYLQHSVASFIPICLLWIFYHSVLQAWWLADDPLILKAVAEHGISPHFYQSDIWRTFSPANLTPWVILSFGVDWHLFGLEPLGYYWHHLISFSVVLLIAYIVLKQFFSPLVCSITLSIFVVSVPSANVAQFLMVRHYLEGLGLSLLAVLFYMKAIKTEQLKWAYLGSIFYLFATTAKEIYVPLVVILPFLPIGQWTQRWKAVFPFAIVAGFYVLWRGYMLKPSYLLTGYGDISSKIDWAGILSLPNRVATIFGWQHSWQLLVILLIGISYLFFIFKYLKTKNQWIKLTLWLSVTFLPIVPVLSILASRFLFLPYFVFCLSIGFLIQFSTNKRWHYIALGLGLSLFAVGIKSIQSDSASFRQVELLERFHTEGNFILAGQNTDDLLFNPVGAEWYYESLLWLRKNVLNFSKETKVCYDLCVCQPQANDKIYQYVQGKFKISQLSEYTQNCGQSDAELLINIYFSSGALHWQFAPYDDGQYYVSYSTNKTVSGRWFALSQGGNYHWELSKKTYFVVKYVSPEGWHTYSPTLTLDPAQKNEEGIVELIWQGP